MKKDKTIIYTKSLWIKRDTEYLLSEARAKFIMSNKSEKPTDDNVINKALGVYLKHEN